MTKSKRPILRLLFFSLLFAVATVSFGQNALLSRAIKDSLIIQKKVMEPNVHYSSEILNTDFDFQLQNISEGKFSINFFNNDKESVSIKVYDIIGNILYEENVHIKGNGSQQIDLSQFKTSFFIVEIKNGQFNKVKSIVAS